MDHVCTNNKTGYGRLATRSEKRGDKKHWVKERCVYDLRLLVK